MKTVAFKNTVLVRDISAARLEETECRWYGSQEIKGIMSDCKRVIEKMEGSRHLSGRDEDIRGLESHLPARALCKRRIRSEAWDAVLSEQELQHIWGTFSPETIAEASLAITKKSARDAHLMALRDAQYVRDHVSDESPLAKSEVAIFSGERSRFKREKYLLSNKRKQLRMLASKAA